MLVSSHPKKISVFKLVHRAEVHICPASIVDPIRQWVWRSGCYDGLSSLDFFCCRSIISVNVPGELDDGGNAWRTFSGHVLVHVAIVLGFCLSRIAPKRPKVHTFLPSEIVDTIAGVAVRVNACNMGKMFRTERSHMDPFCRYELRRTENLLLPVHSHILYIPFGSDVHRLFRSQINAVFWYAA